MNFVYPNFLWACTLVLIPIIIHLFNFRKYKTVYFSRVKFLKEVTEDSRSGTKLKHLLVLISRILAILFLVFAFAQPYVPTGDSANIDNTSLIYIDNSYSMEATGKDGNLLNEVKNQAIELVKSLEESEKVALFTSDLLAEQQRFYSRNEVVEMIKKIDLSPRSTDLTTVLNTQIDLLTGLETKSNRRIFIFSDFQKSTSSLENFKRAEIPCFYYQAEAQMRGNIFVDSVWFETPVHRLNAPIDVFFRIQNLSDMAQKDLSVNLKIIGNEPAPKRISVDANSYATGSINFTDRTAGIKSGSISVATSQLFFDDEFFFTYETKEQVNILIIKNSAKENSNLEQLYGLDPYYHYESTTIDGLTQEQFKGKELIVFQNIDKIPSGIQDLIDQSLKNGSSVVLIPGGSADLKTWNSFLNTHQMPNLGTKQTNSAELTYFNSEDPIYTGVFETEPGNYKNPSVSSSYPLNVLNRQNFVSLFGYSPTRPYLIYSPQSNGRLVLMSSPLDIAFTDFQNHALFAATFLRFAETASFQKPLSMTIGEMINFPFNINIEEKNPVHLVNEAQQVDYIPLMINTGNSRSISFAQVQNEIRQSGFYKLTDKVNFNDILALNYNRKESDISAYSPQEIIDLFKSCGWETAEVLTLDGTGKLEISTLKATEYWRMLLILSLIFFAIEILLLKLWKS